MKPKNATILKATFVLALFFLDRSAPAAVPNSDITLQPVATDNLPIFTSLTGYTATEDIASGSAATQPGQYHEHTLYMPYNNTADAWWDNLLAEELQARLPVLMFATRGAYTLNTSDTTGPGNMNPRRLTSLLNAINRANAGSLVKLACFVDTPSMEGIYTNFHSLPGGTVMDMSVSSDWNDVFWLRGIKPWFDTIPSKYWYEIDGRPVIQFWSLSNMWFSHQNGNASQMLQYVEAQFKATYGLDPVFILDTPWVNSLDPSSASVPAVIGSNAWYGPPSTSYTMTTLKNFVAGTVDAGFLNPAYYDPTNTNYQNPKIIILRNGTSGTGANGDTEKAGLDAAVAINADFTVLEGWTDAVEGAGLYRADTASAVEWDYANQYINMVRSYTDLRTVTLRLEAEGCDLYNAPGGTGGVFRRTGNLGIRALTGSGWAVSNTTAGEWIQFNSLSFSAGNYKFPVRFSTTNASRTLRFYVDGVALPDVTVTSTGGADTFNTIYLGSKYLTPGNHTFKLLFVNGGVDVDWIFVKKYDPLMSFKSALTNCFLTAELGGNDTMVSNRTAEGSWERFSVDDAAGAGTVSAGDTVNLQARDGLYVTSEANGGSTISINRRRAGSYEKFTIVKLNGTGPIVNGDMVALKSDDNIHYVTVKSGTLVDASSTSISTPQTFTINISAQ